MNTSENDLLSRRNDEEAINELIIKYKYLVDGAAAKFQNAPLEKDDIIQEGLIGLLAATKSFNESKGTLFTTYASHCINNSIISAIKKVSRLKDIPQSNIVSIEDEDMFGLVKGSRDVVEAVQMLIDRANSNGGRDNIGVVLAEPIASEESTW